MIKIHVILIKMSYIQSSFEEVQKVNKTIKLTNHPENHNVNALFPELKYLSNIEEAEVKRSITETTKNRKDLQKHLLASSKIGQNIQEEIYLVVTDGRLMMLVHSKLSIYFIKMCCKDKTFMSFRQRYM